MRDLPSPAQEERRMEEEVDERLVIFVGLIPGSVPFLEKAVGSHSGDYRSRV